jgi:L-alanine-DL-glutamate epimerase-like enolase superfamily enzyme
VTDSDGATGVAEAVSRPNIYGETVASILAAYRDFIRPVCLGRSIWEGDRIRSLVDAVLVHNHSARASLDMALADLRARRLDVSLHELFGAWTDGQRVTQLIGIGSPGEMAEQCAKWRAEYGVASFKIKVGHGIERDVEALERIRRDHPDALVYIDANRAYDPVDALRLAGAAVRLGIAWNEEPCTADAPLGRARVAAEGGIPVLGDESCTTPGEVAREVLARRSHMISLKLARTGYGLSERIRGFCESVGAPIVVGTQGESGLGTLANLSYTAAHESTSRYPGELAFFLNLEDDLLTEPLRIVDGRLSVRTGCGNGAELDPEKLARYRLD